MSKRTVLSATVLALIAGAASVPMLSAQPASPPAEGGQAGDGKAVFPNSWFFYGNKGKLLGKPAPELEVSDWFGGSATTMKDLKGKIVVVDFWGVWCGPCRKAIPHTNEMAQKFKDRGVVVLGIHSKRDADKMEEAARTLKMAYPTAKDINGKSEAAYGVEFWPFYVLVDREGNVRAAGLKPDKVGDAIEALLKEQPGAAKG